MLGELATVAARLDQVKLKAMAPQKTWNNEVTPYVNGPQCLEMMVDEKHLFERRHTELYLNGYENPHV